MSRASRAAAEPEPDGVYGLDDAVASHLSELRPNIADVAVDRPVGDVDVRAIGRGHDLIAAEHDVAADQEGLENRKLDGSEVERPAVEFGDVRPVKIVLDQDVALGSLVRPGMSVEATIDTGGGSGHLEDREPASASARP